MRSFFAVLAVCAAPVPAAAQVPKELDFVPRDSFAFVTVKVSDVWDSPTLRPVRANFESLPKILEPAVGFGEADVERVTLFWPMFWESPGADTPFIAVTTRKPYDRAKVEKALKLVDARLRPSRGGEATKLPGDPLFYVTDPGGYVIPLGDRTLVICPGGPRIPDAPVGIALLAQTLNKSDDGPQAAPLALAGKHTVVASFRVSEATAFLKRSKLPADFAPLEDAQSVVVTGDIGKSVTATVKATFPNAESAKKATDAISKLSDLGAGELRAKKKLVGKESAAVDAMLTAVIQGLENAWFATDGPVVTAKAELELTPERVKSFARLPAELAEHIDLADKRKREINNLKQFGLALQNHHDAFEHLPNNVTDKAGKPLLSWRVLILPYIDHGDLYKKFKLDEPWDSEANKKLIPLMPKIYTVPGRDAPAGETFYQSFTAPEKLDGGSPLLIPGVKREFLGISDGTSNTALVTEAADSVI